MTRPCEVVPAGVRTSVDTWFDSLPILRELQSVEAAIALREYLLTHVGDLLQKRLELASARLDTKVEDERAKQAEARARIRLADRKGTDADRPVVTRYLPPPTDPNVARLRALEAINAELERQLHEEDEDL